MLRRFALASALPLLLSACWDAQDASDPDWPVCSDPVAAQSFADPLPVPPLATTTTNADGSKHVELTATKSTHRFKSCATESAATLGYDGDFLGPTIRVRRGDELEVAISNAIDEPTSVHWHGLVPLVPNVDVSAHHLAPGATATVRFPIDQAAATLWYHPHEHMRVGAQVYGGLTGLFLVDDDASDALALPHSYGVDDVPLVVEDRRFAPDGSLEYLKYAEDDDGMLGNRVVVNGTIRPHLAVPRSVVRLRFLNASNARTFAFALEGDRSFFQIASDGGLLAAPAEMTTLVLAPAKRAEILVDLGTIDTDRVRLVSRAFDVPTSDAPMDHESSLRLADADEGAPSGKPKADPQRRIPNGAAMDVLELRVDDSLPRAVTTVPSTLASLGDPDPSTAVNASSPRVFRLEDTGDDVINGKLADPSRVDQTVRQGDVEVWSIVNIATDLAHPFHVHGGPFRVLSRSTGPLSPGDRGLEDTVLVQPGEEAKILVSFAIAPDDYFFHCHILEHEDMGMMGVFRVTPR